MYTYTTDTTFLVSLLRFLVSIMILVMNIGGLGTMFMIGNTTPSQADALACIPTQNAGVSLCSYETKRNSNC